MPQELVTPRTSVLVKVATPQSTREPYCADIKQKPLNLLPKQRHWCWAGPHSTQHRSRPLGPLQSDGLLLRAGKGVTAGGQQLVQDQTGKAAERSGTVRGEFRRK